MIKFFLTIICFIIKIKADNQILITFNSVGNQFIYCDDLINYFGTTYITIYRKLEDKKIKINSNSLIHNINNNDICRNKIYYYSETEYETILIEFKIFPTNLHGLFRQSDINSIEINLDNNNEELDFSNMFQDCEKLTSIDLSKFKTNLVKNMDFMFNNCASLKTIDLSKFETYNLTSMRSMFSDCSSLESIDISNFHTEKVNTMSFLFNACSSLKYANLSNIETKNIIYMDYMFFECPNLLYLDLSSFQNTDYFVRLFKIIPNNTTIKVHKDYVDRIKNMVPYDSNITIIE